MAKTDYYSTKGYISQSELKRLIGKEYDNPSNLGNFVDALATNPEEVADFALIQSKIPPALKKLMETIFLLSEDITNDSIEEANRLVGYGKGRYKTERIKGELMKHIDFWEELYTDKILLSREEYDQGHRLARLLDSHPKTQFLKHAQKQVEIYNEDFHGFKVKGLLDYRLEDSTVVDLKTLYSITAYRKNFWKFRYDIQTAWYRDISYSDKNPFIVFVAPDADYPIIVRVSTPTIMLGRHGGYVVDQQFEIGGKMYPQRKYRYGYMDLLNRYKQLKNLDFTYEPDSYNFIIRGYKDI